MFDWQPLHPHQELTLKNSIPEIEMLNTALART